MVETRDDHETDAPGFPGLAAGMVAAVDGVGLSPLERQARDRLRSWVVGSQASPLRIGRFTLLSRLGSGGMGTVYGAYDDQLDRKVALKFLHPARADDPAAQHRLLREAQALARLSHPHLVPVFEVGRFEGQVYLAMELVAGPTVRQWVDDSQPPWREVLELWLSVGRALALVHAEGLVHRDVKPDNVILGDDGRARLVDFGLARRVGEMLSGQSGDGATTGEPLAAVGTGSRLSESVTVSNAIVGTPAYLSPEQRRGEPCGPATDQYGFCVSLYEGIFGCRPPGPCEPGAVLRVPDQARVPADIRQALARGLAPDSDDRHASMNALLAVLERPLRRRQRGWKLGSVGLLGGAVAMAVALVRPPPPVSAEPPCAGVEAGLDELWNESRRASWANGSHAALVPAIDAFAEDWRGSRREVCEATHVSGVQSSVALDRRMACLDRLRERFSAVVPGPSAGHRVARGLASLAAPRDCLLPGVAEGWSPAPQVIAREVGTAHVRLAEIHQQAIDGDLSGARAEATVEVSRADALGHAPLLASSLVALGRVELLAFRAEPARQALARAVDLAEAHGDLVLKEEALGYLVRLATDVEVEPQRALRSWHRNAATLTRLGVSQDRIARLWSRLALVQDLLDDPIGAEVSLRGAQLMYAEIGPRTATVQASALRNLGTMLERQGRSDEAQEAFEHARTLDGAVGASRRSGHAAATDVGHADMVEGRTLLSQGKLAAARERFERGWMVLDRIHGPHSLATGAAHVALAQVAVSEGALERARYHAEAADLAFRYGAGPDHPRRINSLSALGTVAYEQGHPQAAVRAFDTAVAVAEQHRTADDVELAMLRSNLAEALLLLGRHRVAGPLAEQALRTLESRVAPDDVDLAFPLRALGEASVRGGAPLLALEPLTRALRLHELHSVYPTERARTRAWLARAHHGAGNDAQARDAAAVALVELQALGPSYADDAAQMRRLLDSPGPAR